MRTVKRWFGVLLAFCLILAAAVPVLAAAEDYTYTVRIFAGKQGTIGSGQVLEYTGLHYGDRVTFHQSQVSLKDGSKYYIKGIKVSGRDNDTSRNTSSFPVTGDADYVVSYGLLGSSVAYTINYVDTDGNILAPSETYYGNVGDHPVIAYLYIEGYQPQVYNLTTSEGLKEDASRNVFTFVYNRMETAENNSGGDTNTPGNNMPGNNPVNNNPENNNPENPPQEDNNPGNAENPNNLESQTTETEPEEPGEVATIEEPDVPLANANIEDAEAGHDGTTLPAAVKGLIGVGAAAVVAAAGFLLFRRIRNG